MRKQQRQQAKLASNLAPSYLLDASTGQKYNLPPNQHVFFTSAVGTLNRLSGDTDATTSDGIPIFNDKDNYLTIFLNTFPLYRDVPSIIAWKIFQVGMVGKRYTHTVGNFAPISRSDINDLTVWVTSNDVNPLNSGNNTSDSVLTYFDPLPVIKYVDDGKYSDVQWTPNNSKTIPKNSVQVGQRNGEPLYYGRYNSWIGSRFYSIPGYVHNNFLLYRDPISGLARVLPIEFENVEILTGTTPVFWRSFEEIQNSLVESGIDVNDKLYSCRFEDGSNNFIPAYYSIKDNLVYFHLTGVGERFASEPPNLPQIKFMFVKNHDPLYKVTEFLSRKQWNIGGIFELNIPRIVNRQSSAPPINMNVSFLCFTNNGNGINHPLMNYFHFNVDAEPYTVQV